MQAATLNMDQRSSSPAVTKALEKHRDRVAVQLDLSKLNDFPPLVQTKFLALRTMTVGDFRAKVLEVINAKLKDTLPYVTLAYRREPLLESKLTLAEALGERQPKSGGPHMLMVLDPRRHVPVRLCAQGDLVLQRRDHIMDAGLTMTNVMRLVRRQVELGPEHGLYLTVGTEMPALSAMLSFVFIDHADADGVLHVNVCRESTFGA
jgi:hypothetical protein